RRWGRTCSAGFTSRTSRTARAATRAGAAWSSPTGFTSRPTPPSSTADAPARPGLTIHMTLTGRMLPPTGLYCTTNGDSEPGPGSTMDCSGHAGGRVVDHWDGPSVRGDRGARVRDPEPEQPGRHRL